MGTENSAELSFLLLQRGSECMGETGGQARPTGSFEPRQKPFLRHSTIPN